MSDPQINDPPDTGPTDDQKAEARLAWLESAQSEEEVHLIETALLAETVDDPQAGESEEGPS
jgi:hypothetical protein